jgi:hypothetical protein
MGYQFGIQAIAVIGLVANDSRRFLFGEHEAEKILDQTPFRGEAEEVATATGSPLASTRIMILTPSRLGAAVSILAALGFGEGSIDEALIEAKAALLINKSAESLAKGFQRHRP